MDNNKWVLVIIAFLFFGLTAFKYEKDEKLNGNTKEYSLNHGILTDTLKNYQYLIQPDTIHRKFISTKSDSNFTYTKYVDFLNKISDTSKYIVVPINEFIKTINPKKVIIGLRHDVDLDLNIAFNLSKVENNVGFQSTYYILHTANYYLANPNNKAIHSDLIIPILKTMQNTFHHEIGWHNDLVTLQLIYKINSVSFLHQELSWLRSNGLNVCGTASHGSNYCYTYKYLNYYFFEEHKSPTIGQFVNNESALVGGQMVKIMHAHQSDFNLDYEAYFINFNKYYSDASFINGKRWNFGMLDLNTLHPGDRVQILMHPIYYSSTGSDQASILTFSLKGQYKSTIDYPNAKIEVEMPANTKTDSLIACFTLSPKAKIYYGSRRLASGVSAIDYTSPINLKVVAENGLTSNDWTITINQLPPSTGEIFGATIVCQGQKSVTYTIPSIKNAISYEWTLPLGAIGTSTTNSITIDFGTSALSGNISVKGVNAYGAGAESTLPIVVNVKPVTPTIVQNDNVLLSDAIVGNQWYNQNGLIYDAINQEYKATSNGNYFVVVTADGCSSEPSRSINILTIGVDNISSRNSIKTYPNPLSNQLIIEIKGNTQKTDFEIFNSFGQVIYKGCLFEKVVIQTSNFSPGVYVVKFNNGKTFDFKKVLKE